MYICRTKSGGRRGRRGLALVGILLLLTVMALLAVLMAAMGSANQRMAGSQLESEVALYSAEAGLTVALQEYLRDPDYQGNEEPQPFGDGDQSYQVSLYNQGTPPPDGTVVPDDHTPGSEIDFTGGELYGSLVGKRVTLSDGASIHYDEVLSGLKMDPWGNGGFFVLQKSYRRV